MSAPLFRSVCQLTGEKAESPIAKMLDTADRISGQAAELERLREENLGLRCRIDELKDENAGLKRDNERLLVECDIWRAWAGAR